MSRKMKNILILISLIVVVLGLYFKKDKIEPVPDEASRNAEYALIPIDGDHSLAEKKATLEELEKLAKTGNKEAIYQYLNNPDSPKRSLKTEALIKPFIESKDPKMMYLKYTLIREDINLLLDAANANYPDAVYLLYQIYNGDKESDLLRKDVLLAKVYLTLSADLDHHDGLIKKIEDLTQNNSNNSPYFSETLKKYIDKLLEKYPDSYQAILTVANVYSNPKSSFYDPDKAFELVNSAYKIQPSPESKLSLAKLYANGEGTVQNLKKAVNFLQENIRDNKLLDESQHLLVRIYFEFDVSEYIAKEHIVDILKESVNKNKANTFNQDYRLAHYYADILLEQDAIKNKEYAFSLYKKASYYTYVAYLHQAIAIMKYKNRINNDVFIYVIKALEDDLENGMLTKKERKEGYDLLLKYGMNSPRVIDFIVERSLFDEEVRTQVQPLLNKNINLAFKYTIRNIIYENSAKNLNEEKLRKYYKDIFKLAELGSTEAMQFIVTTRYVDENMLGRLYHDHNFDNLTNITAKERFAWRHKCANLGNNICLKDLSLIYQEGKEGIQKDAVKAQEYEKRISIDLSSPELELYEIVTRTREGRDNDLNRLMKQEESDKKLLELARFYSYEDRQKSFTYAEKAYDLGNKKASKYLYNYYMENICEDKDNINKATNYFQEWIETEKPRSNEFTYNSTRIIADYYLEAPCLVEQNLDKAIEWYQLSLDYPFGIDNRIYTELNKIYSNGLDSVSQDPAVNIYVSTLKNHNDYIVDMNVRLGKMSFAEPSFSKLYEAYLFKGDAKEAYYYGLLMNRDVSNVAMFYSLSENERKNIETRVTEYLNQNKQ
ncbi:TPA: sel1 repeat family protein [Proteus mirabilis]